MVASNIMFRKLSCSPSHMCRVYTTPSSMTSRLHPHRILPRSAFQSSRYYSSSTSIFSASLKQRRRPLTFGAIGLLLAATGLYFATPLRADSPSSKGANPAFTKNEVGLVCVIGGPASGKSTQIRNIVERFGLEHLQSADNLKQQLQDRISSNTGQQKPRLIVEGFPVTLSESQAFEKEVVRVLLVIFLDLDQDKALARVKEGDARETAKAAWAKFTKDSEAIVKRYRLEGNIIEITAEWPKDEVWEQVEAKFESILELDDRGDLYEKEDA